MSEGTPSYRYYSSIALLPLRNYINAIVHENLAALTIEGFPPEEELRNALMDIRQEYADAMKDFEYGNYLKMLREVSVLEITLKQVDFAVIHLRRLIPLYFDEWREEIVREKAKEAILNIGCELNIILSSSFDFLDKENYESYLKRCINRKGGIVIEHNLKKLNFEAIQEKFEGNKKPDEEYFQSVLISLSNHAGYHLTDQITVFEFCERLKRLNKEAEQKK